MTAILVISFLAFLMMGVPVAFSAGIASFLAIVLGSDLPTVVVAQRIYATLGLFFPHGGSLIHPDGPIDE